MLQVNAIKIQPKTPFTWASGWLSPVYCDNRVTLSYPELRSFICHQLVKRIRDTFSEAELIAGVATAGIPQGVLVADRLNLPFAYVRPEPKKHGLAKQIEGRVFPEQKVVVIEDLISTGKSSLNALRPLEAEGCKILGIVATFSYGFPEAENNFRKAGYTYEALTGWEALLKAGLRKKCISPDDLELLHQWRQHPDRWRPVR
ncbi:MAG: orotate phosphoribosyltransferase [Chitinophagales bacterium]|nr:MAG: orotate phosphoribosyltransferase [Chitinophagales bacterium]